MPRRVRLQDYHTEYLSDRNQVRVLVTGDKIYYTILDKTFPGRCSSLFDDFKKIYDWGTFIRVPAAEAEQIDSLLNMFTYAVCIVDTLHQSFALDYYYRPYWSDPEGGHSLAGRLVNQVKYKQKSQSDQFNRLISYAARFIKLHPAYRRSDYLIGMPYFGEKPFDLPEHITTRLCHQFAIANGRHLISKSRSTKPMKKLDTREEKEDNIFEAFQVSATDDISGKCITLIDDVYRSGTTMQTVASILQSAGAIVQGLVMAKTIRG